MQTNKQIVINEFSRLTFTTCCYAEMSFTRRELRALTELYQEEIFHFGKVTAQGYRLLLLECGEVLRLLRVQRYFQEMSLGGNYDFVTTYQEFMYVTALVKAHKVSNIIKNQKQLNN